MDKRDDELSAIDTLEQKLYDPKGAIDHVQLHHVRDRKEKELPTSWGQDTPIIRAVDDHTGLSFGAKFLLGALGLLLVVLSFAAWQVFSSGNIVSDKKIDMTLDITPSIEGGEATPLVVSLNNRNDVALEEATLTLMYKQGNGAQDEQEKVQVKKDLGIVNPADFKRQEFEVMVYGSEAESRDITVKLEYKVKGQNAKFNKVVVTQVVLKTPPISIHIDGPTTLSVGQIGTFTFTVKNNTSTTTTPSIVQATLPTNFIIEDTTPKSSTRGTLWQVPALDAGGTYIITVAGSLSGAQGEASTVRALVGSVGGSLTEVGVVYSSEILTIGLRTSPLLVSMSLTTDRGTGETLQYGDRSLISIVYKNGSTEPLQNVEIVLKISGDAALMKDIGVDDGYYDSVAGTITWSQATTQGLGTLQAGGGGTLQVRIPIVNKGTNSPKLTLAITGKGSAQEVNDIVATQSKTFVVQGSASVSAETHYKTSPFQNVGPIPPQPNVDTTYTAHLTVSAQNALQNTKVSFVLPVYVTWRNITNDGGKTTYDSKTRTVTWNIGALDAGKTVATDIGLSVRPSQVHVGSSPFITGGMVLDADEVESRSHLRTSISGLTTYIGGESWTVNPSVVVER